MQIKAQILQGHFSSSITVIIIIFFLLAATHHKIIRKIGLNKKKS